MAIGGKKKRQLISELPFSLQKFCLAKQTLAYLYKRLFSSVDNARMALHDFKQRRKPTQSFRPPQEQIAPRI